MDILKIDAEGYDNKVISGAMKAIKEKAGVFTFEGGKGVSLTKEMVADFDKSVS